MVTATSEAEAAEKLRAAGLEPDFICETPSVTADVAWCHRRYGKGVEAYFVACGVSDRAVELTCSFRQARGVVELWDAETGEIRRARRVARQGGRTRVTLALKPSGSVFVVFRPSSSAPFESSFAPVAETPVAGPWTVTLGAKTCVWTNLVDWAASDDPEIRYFSGTGAYETMVHLPACGAGERLVLDLGNLRNLAEAFVDGVKLPTLWRPPFRCVLPPGPARTARLRVEVTNLWPNRLIGDDFLPEDADRAANGGVKAIPAWVTEGRPSPTGRTTFTTWRHWTKDDRPLPSGLFGPVRLVTERSEPADTHLPAGQSSASLARCVCPVACRASAPVARICEPPCVASSPDTAPRPARPSRRVRRTRALARRYAITFCLHLTNADSLEAAEQVALGSEEPTVAREDREDRPSPRGFRLPRRISPRGMPCHV